MPILIRYDNGRERIVIGTMDYDKKEFSKKVKSSIHLYKKLDAWGMDAEHFNDVLLPNKYTILLVDAEKKVRYRTTASIFKEHGTYLHFKDAFRDHGAQVFLPRKFWNQEKYVQGNPKRKFKGVIGSLPKL